MEPSLHAATTTANVCISGVIRIWHKIEKATNIIAAAHTNQKFGCAHTSILWWIYINYHLGPDLLKVCTHPQNTGKRKCSYYISYEMLVKP